MTIVVGILLLLAAASFATDLIFQNSRSPMTGRRLTPMAPGRHPKRIKAKPDWAGRRMLTIHLRGGHARSWR